MKSQHTHSSSHTHLKIRQNEWAVQSKQSKESFSFSVRCSCTFLPYQVHSLAFFERLLEVILGPFAILSIPTTRQCEPWNGILYYRYLYIFTQFLYRCISLSINRLAFHLVWFRSSILFFCCCFFSVTVSKSANCSIGWICQPRLLGLSEISCFSQTYHSIAVAHVTLPMFVRLYESGRIWLL